MADSCAVRQLTLQWPVAVRPMTEYGGGYTAGVGSVAWSVDHAETWRAGWCAVGVFCASPPARGATADARFATPRGLYSHERATLYVRDPGDDAPTRSTVAHEVVHALQYQNFPALHAAHIWFNRDLNAAVDAVVEGDAHLVGWSFEPERRRHLCSVAPADTAHVHRDWWRWTPQAVSALERFPHVFGPGFVFDRLLAGGTPSVDALLLDPPLSSLAVLRPDTGAAVDFIALPTDLDRHVTDRACKIGLRNTVGVVGIWGLLAQHAGTAAAKDKDAAAKEMPEFLTEWAGDRFVHVVCEGERNDELAWLTRWRNPAAAAEFARRFKGVAAQAARHGGVLDAPPQIVLRSSVALVVTPNLRTLTDALLRAPVRTFDRYADWIAAGCFPHDCHGAGHVATGGRGQFACSAAAPPPAAFHGWLGRVRQARARAEEMQGEAPAFALNEAGRLAVFCARNARRNADILAACRAFHFGLRHLAAISEDAHWRLLPLCASDAEYRAQLRTAFAAAEGHGGNGPRRELDLRAAELAATALRAGGIQGMRRLVAAPPLSTLELLDPSFVGAVDFLHLSPAALAAGGCEELASDVVGALGLWTRLRSLGLDDPVRAPPAIVRAWRGDRQWYLRCGGQTGWVWASRWVDATAAREFAARHLAAWDDGVEMAAEVDERTVWVAPTAFADVRALVKASMQSRSFAAFGAWRAEGCYPQPVCHE